LALVTSGAVAEGMRNLDEVNAAVVAGELKDLIAIGLSCCYLIAACDRVRDYDRAFQWCTRLKAFSAKWGLRPLFAVCRTQYASICMWRGTWIEAEAELTAATQELAASRPAMTADGIVRLAELRRRQGRLVEAAALFDRADPHPLAAMGRAELAFDRGDGRAAAGQVDIARRHLEDAVDLFLRCGAPYELARSRIELARVLASMGRVDAALVEARRAIDLLTELKAELELSHARALVESLSTHDRKNPADKQPGGNGAGLTAREIEVLRLIADGLNNQTIGARLFLSEHTVHRHVA